jgi:hypothetical protein
MPGPSSSHRPMSVWYHSIWTNPIKERQYKVSPVSRWSALIRTEFANLWNCFRGKWHFQGIQSFARLCREPRKVPLKTKERISFKGWYYPHSVDVVLKLAQYLRDFDQLLQFLTPQSEWSFRQDRTLDPLRYSLIVPCEGNHIRCPILQPLNSSVFWMAQ